MYFICQDGESACDQQTRRHHQAGRGQACQFQQVQLLLSTWPAISSTTRLQWEMALWMEYCSGCSESHAIKLREGCPAEVIFPCTLHIKVCLLYGFAM